MLSLMHQVDVYNWTTTIVSLSACFSVPRSVVQLCSGSPSAQMAATSAYLRAWRVYAQEVELLALR
jgi:hypothetical protein